jgi:NAD(P)-dependent dehydrogenase (short-subunit alcohol dehydrogenase family)
MGILEKMRLDGKTTLITGGARGIGKSLAAALGEAGTNLVIADLDLDEAEKTVSSLKKNGVKAIAVRADATVPDDVLAMVEAAVGEFGELNVAFCNAGIVINKKAEEMSLEEWRKVIDINLTGVFLTATAAGRQMIKQGKGGSIINTASMSAHIVNFPQPQCSYNASKAGVIQLTKSLAVEWADKNIRVNCISPGYMGTELLLASETLKPLIKAWESVTPMRRIGRPEELQALAVYLAGDASSFTTGSDFIVDGAFTCV